MVAARQFAMLAAFFALIAGGAALASVKRCEGKQGVVAVLQTAKESNIKFVYSTFGFPSFQMIVLQNATKLPSLAGFSCEYGPANFSATLKSKLGAAVANAFGLVIPVVYEFNDWSGSAKYNPSLRLQTVSLANLLQNLSSSDATTVDATTFDSVFDISVNIHGSSGTDGYSPFLPFDAESMSTSFTVSNFSYNGTTSKLAIPIYVASTYADFSLSTTQSINDEYTPSVFLRTDLTSASEAYMFWKPVAYGGSDRDPTNSTFALPSDLYGGNASVIEQSLAAAFLADASHSAATTVVFGEKGDKTYNFGYITWAFVFGSGKPVTQGLSGALLATIIATNGLPVVALLAGSAYFIYKRSSGKRYTPLHVN